MFIRFDVIHERDGQTDGRTDGQTLHDSKDRACIASRGKNWQPGQWGCPQPHPSSALSHQQNTKKEL